MNSQRRNLGSRGARRGGRRRGLRGTTISPPEFVPTLSLGHKFRFSTGVAFTGLPVTRAMLLNLYTMATTTSNQNRLVTAVKLKRVQVWGSPPIMGSGAPTTVVVEWLGNQAPSTIHSDTGMGVRPSYVSSRPPVDSSDRWWSISGTNESEVLFKISGPIGTVIDIQAAVRLADDEAAVAAENGTAVMSTVGKVYFNYLDGFASKLLTPAGGVSILP